MCRKSSESSETIEAPKDIKAGETEAENIPMIRRGPQTQSKKLCANHTRHQIPMDEVRIIENQCSQSVIVSSFKTCV